MEYNAIVILGPTASGKTNISLELAKKLGGEIVNADSMQIYKYFDIGTAKPTEEELNKANHHLFDFVEPNTQFSVSEYRELALQKFDELQQKNILPIFVGGTGFYINSLVSNYSYGNTEKNSQIREKYEKILLENGIDYLYELLKKIDIDSSEKIHKNDTKRVIRALEIFETTGIKKSETKNKTEESKIKPLIIGLTYPRDILYNRINKRVDLMFEAGLLDEVETLYKKYSGDCPAFNGIGYKEFLPYFKGEISLDQVLENIKMNTRRYAKRQLTWFRKTENVIWFDKSQISESDIVDKVIDIIKS